MPTALLPPNADGIATASALLREGLAVAMPTETVYGLAADATSPAAVARIFAAKGRPGFNPLICHVGGAAEAADLVVWSATAAALASAFWPGPLTLVLPRRRDCPIAPAAAAGLPTLAVRAPVHPVAQALLAACGRPLAAPSANISGHVSPTTAAHVLADLDGRIAAVLDGGPCLLGLESSVLDLSGGKPALLREGAIAAEALEALLGPLRRGATPGARPASPGLFASHYAPRLPLRLGAHAAQAGEALLAFGPAPAAALTYQLSESGDVAQAAARLFAGLRWLDATAPAFGLRAIAAMAVPRVGVGVAINDRLARAGRKEGLLF